MLKKKTANIMLKMYIYLFILLSTRLWGLYQYTKIGLYSETFSIISITAVSVIFCVVIVCKNSGTIRISRNYKWLLVTLLIIVGVEIMNSLKINPGQGLLYTMVEASLYISIPLVFCTLWNLIKTQEDVDWTIKVFSSAAILLSCTSIVQRLIYNKIILFPSEVAVFRNGVPRIFIGGSVVYTIGLLALIYEFLQKEVSLKYGVGFIICFLRVFWVEQQRAFSMVFVVLIALLYIKKIANRKLRIILMTLIFTVGGLVIIFGDMVLNAEMFLSGDVSAIARGRSIEFFLLKAKEYPLLGMGFIGGTTNVQSTGYWLLRDNSGFLAQRTDVGIFGLINMWGIFGVLWYIDLLLHFRKKARKEKGNNMASILFLYSVLTSFTLILTDPQRVLLIPIFLVFSCFKGGNVNDKSCFS